MQKTYAPPIAPSTSNAGLCPSEPIGPVARVIAFVAREMRVARHEIYANERSCAPSQARHVAIWIARRKHAKSLNVIGRIFGGRDRSTVHNSVVQVERLRAADPAFLARTNDLLARAP